MNKKKTIGANPLAAYLDKSVQRKEKKTKPQKPELPKAHKQRVTIHLSVDIIERVKNIVFWEPGLTLTDFAEQALGKLLEKYEKKRGKKYPERKEQLKGGRPLG